MRRYLIRRIVQSVITLFLATVVVFIGVRALPGDPARALAGEESDPAVVDAIRHKYGLDQSIPVQYWHFLSNTVRGDLGQSLRTRTPVTEMIGRALPVTIELSLLALLVAAAIGIATGVLAASHRGRPTEWMANGFALVSLSVPNFWLGLIGILYLSVALGVFPASGFVPFLDDPAQNLLHLVMPSVILGTGLAAIIMRQTRSSMIEALDADYVRTARAKGVGERSVVGVHALRNSLIVVVTIVGLQLGTLISGAVVTERVFGLPGFGKLTLDSVFQRDYPVIQAVVLVTASAYIIINLLIDLLYSVIDPRIRVAGEAT